MIDRGLGVEFVQGNLDEFVELFRSESQRQALPGELPQFLDEASPLARRGVDLRSLRDERPLPLPHLKQPVAAEPLVDAQDRVLIDAEVAGQFANRGQPISRLQTARGAQRGDLPVDLPGDRNGRAFFDAEEHVRCDISPDEK